MSFEDWLKSLGVVMESLSAEQMDAYKAAYAAVQGQAPSPPAANASMNEDNVMAESKNDTMQAGAAWDAVDIRAAHADALDSLDNDLLSIEDDAPAAILAEAKKTARKALGDLKAKAARNRLSADTYRAKAGEIIAKAQLAIVRGSRRLGPSFKKFTRARSCSACRQLTIVLVVTDARDSRKGNHRLRRLHLQPRARHRVREA